jgi:5-methylcytosine-specific restriction protein A
MPTKPAKPCKHPNCPALTHNSYCDAHAPLHKRKSPTERGYTPKWNRLRKLYLQRHPLCVMCGRAAEVVDHVRPHRNEPALMWDEGNWQALCAKCHNTKTGRQDSRPTYRY